MSDISYEVEISFNVQDLQSRLSSIRVPSDIFTGGPGGRAAIGALKSTVENIAGTLTSAFTGAVEKAGDVALSLGKIAAIGGIAAATYGVAGLNKELESTQFSLASIFNTAGYTQTFNGAMTLASQQMAKMKSDVNKLPADFQQLATMMTTISTLGGQAGQTPDEIREFAGRSLLFARIKLGIQYTPQLAAREMAGLLGGRAGTQNVLARQMGLIGDEAKEFNHLSVSDRFKRVQQEMFSPKMNEAADAFSETWVTAVTTLKNNIEFAFLAPATSPLFDSIKKTVNELNAWFTGPGESIVYHWSHQLGMHLKDAFEWGKKTFLEWLPAIEQFASDAYDRISSIWEKLEPTISHIGDVIKESLSNGDALDKLESILKLYSAVKIGGAVAHDLSPMMNPMLMFALRGGSGGGSAAGGISPIAAAAQKAMAEEYARTGSVQTAGLLAQSQMASGAELGSGLSAVTVAGIAAGAALLTVAGALDTVNNSSAKFHETASDSWEAIKKNFEEMKSGSLGEGLRLAADSMGVAGLKALEFGGDLALLPDRFEKATLGLMGFQSELESANRFGRLTKAGRFDSKFMLDGAGHDVLSADTMKAMAEKMPKAHVTTNQTFNITVSSNQEPSRIAREVHRKFADTARYSTTSPYVRNWQAGRQ